jgi:putative flippase GtrA
MNGTSEQEQNKSLYQHLHGLLSGKGFHQLMRYGLVGIVINAALYIGYLCLVFFGIEPKISMSIVYVIGLGVGFYGHKNLTFFHTENFKYAIARYLISHVGGYAINFFLLLAFVDYMNLSHALVQGISVFIVAAYLFIIFKYWVFSEKNYANS